MIDGISIVVGFKNRNLERIKYSLDSLELQIFSSFEVIFIDYGSDELVALETRNLVESYNFTLYKYINTKGWLWNRAHALNIGIRYAKKEIILIFDIDLILEPFFLEKISSFNYSDSYYTFSSFYLPEKVNYQSELTKTAIHYNQNYVGLCAISKNKIFEIKGFDEYYLVWGVEDDDFYKRLSLAGLSRIQLNANDYHVFHQWHESQAPMKPSFWYLTMISNFFKNTNLYPNSDNWGLPIAKTDRFFCDSFPQFDKVTTLSFWSDQNLLFFNSFLQKFFQLDSGEIAGIEYVYSVENVSKIRNCILKFKQKKKKSISSNDIFDFINYFIGTNRNLIDDYYFENYNNMIRLIIKRK